MPTPIPPTTATAVIIARVNAHLARRGLSATGLARSMGRSHTWLLRKLDPSHTDPRPIMLEDLDTVAAHLGMTGAELLAPCLTADEHLVLEAIREHVTLRREALTHPEHVPTLIDQGLVLDKAGDLVLTPLAA